jgi:Flp pilus assembly protein TadD
LNADACRILARVAEHDGQPAAIEWRRQVVAAAPDSIEDEVALAKTALQFNKINVAESALLKAGAAAEHLPVYHEVQAQLAAAKKDPITAEKQYAEAVKLDPSNKLYQFNLAALRLQSGSREIREEASASLKLCLDDRNLRVAAARALREYAIQHQDLTGLLEITAQLRDYPEATFHDRMSYLQVLHALDRPEFSARLTELQSEAANDSGKMAELISWMSSNQLSFVALDWIKGLPVETTKEKAVPAAIADCYVATGDWAGLQQWCKKAAWGNIDFLRHCYLSRAMRERGDRLSAESEWNAAVQAAGSDGNRLFALEQGATKWGWKKEAMELLWVLGKDPERQSSALATLYQYYVEKGETADLYRVVARISEIKPDDPTAQNNLAQLSLLLNVNPEHAHELAEKLHQKDPTNPVFTSTYGFSLYVKGRSPQAVKVMSALQPDDLRRPAIAAYYGIFLAAAGDKSKAAEYLERGSQAPLLPEEKLLLANARNKIKATQP